MSGRAFTQEAVLQALVPGSCMMVDALASATGLTHHQVVEATMRLIRRELIERVEVGCFQLTAEGETARANRVELRSGPQAGHTAKCKARKKDFRTRIWRAIAALDKFTVADVVAVAADGSERNALNNAQSFLRILAMGGYVQRLPVREKGSKLTSNGFIRYRRRRHTGPMAPVQRKHCLYDPNTNEAVPCLKK